jgi:hypothetical protein
VKRLVFGPPSWLYCVNLLAVGFAVACAVTIGSTEWVIPMFAAVWIASDFPTATIVDESGVCQRRIFGLRTVRVPYVGSWVEHERPVADGIPGDVHVCARDGTTIRFRGTPEENAQFLAELRHRGIAGRIR